MTDTNVTAYNRFDMKFQNTNNDDLIDGWKNQLDDLLVNIIGMNVGNIHIDAVINLQKLRDEMELYVYRLRYPKDPED